jgi:uncharacterized protein
MSDNGFRARYGPWAVITGASDGIGRALARALAGRGINLVLTARNQIRLEALAQELRADHGIETRVIAADLADSARAAAVADQTRDLDVGLIVLAAGFGTAGPFAELALSSELEMIAVNITAVTALAHAFTPRLIARRRGGVVMFGSITGWQGVPGHSAYAATKAYAQAFAEGLYGELRPHGVDVLSVAPGPVHTGFAARAGLTMKKATTPNVVANATLAALGRRVTIAPGLRAKLLTAGLTPLPRRARSVIVAGVMRRMRTPVTAS